MNLRDNRADELFFQALEQPEQERLGFLRAACGADHELLAEVESLLKFDRGGHGAPLAEIVGRAASDLAGDDAMIGQRLNNWEIVSVLGRGGMGTVYLATRADDAFNKLVAIKLVKRGFDTDSVLRRFDVERRILAGLDHPYIARLVDGGTTSDGRPYFVMEYVNGEAIDRFCFDRQVSLEDICRMFQKVCQAVAFAHRSLVIHRDLKPGNILITEDGTPKLLDFGIARLLNAGEESDPAETQTGVRALTPAYASPEQMLGLRVNTTTDVYSLGAILYRLLTRQTPHQGPVDTAPKPSEAVAPALRRRIQGDLDNIVGMAMRTEPARRYQSADQMAEDIERYLDGRPLLARRDTLGYLAVKFLRRHRGPVLAAAALALTIFAGAGAAIWQAGRAELQARRAEEQKQIAELRLREMLDLANRTLFDVHGQIERLPGSLEVRRELVRHTITFLERLAQDDAGNPDLQYVLAIGWGRVADVQGNPSVASISDPKAALVSAGRAGAMLDQLIARDPHRAQYLVARASQHERMANIYNLEGNVDEALLEFSRGMGLLDKLPASEREKIPALSAALDLYSSRSDVMQYRDRASAMRDATYAIGIGQKLLAAQPDDIPTQISASAVYGSMGMILSLEDRFAEAMPWFRKAATVREQIVAKQPWNHIAQRQLMFAYAHLGDITGATWKASLNQPAASVGWYGKAVAIAERLWLADQTDETARVHYGTALTRLGMVHGPANQYDEGIRTLDRALQVLEGSEVARKNIVARRQVAMVEEYLGRYWRAKKDYARSIRHWERSLEVALEMSRVPRTAGSAALQKVIGYAGLAEAHAEAGRHEEAARYAAEGLRLARLPDPNRKGGTRVDVWVPRLLATNAFVREKAGDRAAASGFWRQCRDEWRRLSATPNFAPYRKELEAAERKAQPVVAAAAPTEPRP